MPYAAPSNTRPLQNQGTLRKQSGHRFRSVDQPSHLSWTGPYILIYTQENLSPKKTDFVSLHIAMYILYNISYLNKYINKLIQTNLREKNAFYE